jgi:hypothetical protein
VGGKEQTVSYTKGVHYSHSVDDRSEWSHSTEKSASVGFHFFGQEAGTSVTGTTSRSFSQEFSSTIEMEETQTLTEQFGPGSVWQFQLKVTDDCGTNTVMTAAFALTSNGNSPCCLPNSFQDSVHALGYCKVGSDGRVFDSCRANECPTCNGHGKPAQSWHLGQPCTCVCDEWFTGPTCADLHIDGDYRIRSEADNRMWHADDLASKMVDTECQNDDGYSHFHIAKEHGQGTYTIRVQFDKLVLHTDSGGDKMVSTRCQQDSGYTRYRFEHRPEHGGSFTIRVEATNENLHAGSNRRVSVLCQEDTPFTRFLLQKLSGGQQLMVLSDVGVSTDEEEKHALLHI